MKTKTEGYNNVVKEAKKFQRAKLKFNVFLAKQGLHNCDKCNSTNTVIKGVQVFKDDLALFGNCNDCKDSFIRIVTKEVEA